MTIRALKAQIKGAKPDFIFLSEIKASLSKMEFVRKSSEFNHKLVVEAKGKASGLCMMWKDGLSAKLAEFNKNLIAVTVSDPTYD